MRITLDEIKYRRVIVDGIRVELTPRYQDESFIGYFLEFSIINHPHIIGSPKLPPEYKVTSSGGEGGGSTVEKIEDTEIPRWVGTMMLDLTNELDEERIKGTLIELNKKKYRVRVRTISAHDKLELEILVNKE